LCVDNAEYFSKATSWSGYSERMVKVSIEIQDCTGTLRSTVVYGFICHISMSNPRTVQCIYDLY
ncbi:hypothetical protein ANCDUO_26414, partial [Ancylostoma duodenale]